MKSKKNGKMNAELRRLARKGRLSERNWIRHQVLNMPWGESFVSPRLPVSSS
jgi:hypothetical protein